MKHFCETCTLLFLGLETPSTIQFHWKPLFITTTSSLAPQHSKARRVSQLKATAFHHLSQINSGTLVITPQWWELIKVLWPPCVSLHRSRCAKIRISPLWIFSEREQWADQIATEHKRGIDCSQTTDVVLFLQQRKGEKEETQRGLESRVTLREIWICFFFF